MHQAQREGAVGVWLNRDALLGSVLDSRDYWNGRTEGPREREREIDR